MVPVPYSPRIRIIWILLRTRVDIRGRRNTSWKRAGCGGAFPGGVPCAGKAGGSAAVV